jgi:hypothetical protein
VAYCGLAPPSPLDIGSRLHNRVQLSLLAISRIMGKSVTDI